jgi:hypothetical protein
VLHNLRVRFIDSKLIYTYCGKCALLSEQTHGHSSEKVCMEKAGRGWILL